MDDPIREALLRGEVHSFVIRLWYEPREIEGATPLLRGEIREVRGGRVLHFGTFGEIEACVRRLVETRAE